MICLAYIRASGAIVLLSKIPCTVSISEYIVNVFQYNRVLYSIDITTS